MSTASDALSLEKWRAVVGSAGERLSLEKWHAGHRLAPCRSRPTERKSLQTTCAPVDPRSTAPIVRAVVAPCPRPIPSTSPRLLHPKRASGHHMRPLFLSHSRISSFHSPPFSRFHVFTLRILGHVPRLTTFSPPVAPFPGTIISAPLRSESGVSNYLSCESLV